MKKHMKKRTVIAGVFALMAISATAAVMTIHSQAGKIQIFSAGTSVTRTIPGNGGQWGGVGVAMYRVTYGDAASAANTSDWYHVSADSGQTNKIIAQQVFTNSYTYSPTQPLYFDAGDSFIFANSVSGATIEVVYYPYQ